MPLQRARTLGPSESSPDRKFHCGPRVQVGTLTAHETVKPVRMAANEIAWFVGPSESQALNASDLTDLEVIVLMMRVVPRLAP